ncbi:TPA: protein-methionine-sulfoxide reductase heme-binding subunit MsrQ [Serratia marcescens]|nr:protein-methionine-sulfoxide reductase heme-binding subunit MsrQ [Serratia marcescens]
MRLTPVHIKWLKAALHLAAFLPFLWLVLAVDQGWFSADPSKDIQHFTGRMTLRLLLATLMIAPLARYARQPLLIRCRRLVGLWCFAWGTLHLISYSTLELGLSNLGLLGSELVNRPYLTLGILTWLILLALAATSTLWAMRKLGAKWQMLHNFVYLAAILAPIHYLWSVKTFSPQPFIYALLAVALLGLRYKKFRAWWR